MIMYNRAGHPVSEVGALVAVFGTLMNSNELILKNIKRSESSLSLYNNNIINSNTNT